MPVEVPFLADCDIEKAAQLLIDDFARVKTPIGAPPVPIERLVRYLGLSQEIDDLYSLLNLERTSNFDLLGALCLNSRRVFVHNEIDPALYPWREGRYNFTLAHEVGHWVLHRSHLPDNAAQLSFLDAIPKPAIICRNGNRGHRIEVQANKFASGVLMPRMLVFEAWQRHFNGGSNPSAAQRDASIKILAKQFQCSIQAMRIRLDTLGLLDGSVPPDLEF